MLRARALMSDLPARGAVMVVSHGAPFTRAFILLERAEQLGVENDVHSWFDAVAPGS